MWIDSHAHLCQTDESDFFAQLERAKNAGVCGIINIGTNIEESRIAVERAKLPTPIKTFAAIGVCVPESGNFSNDLTWVEELNDLAASKEVVAIGETGLDGAKKEGYPSHDLQIFAFKKQIELAKLHNLPLIVHSRMQDEEVLELCVSSGIKKALFHCFTGTAESAKKITGAGYFVSFSGIITFAKSDLNDAIKVVPTERILIETDAPWLAPVPFRGKQNEPAYVRFTGQKIAQIRGIDENILAKTIKDNTQNFFGTAF